MSAKPIERFLPLVPGLLLVAVAVWQIHLVHEEALSPWKGGGFGMFATTDVEANRYTRLYLRRGSAAISVQLPPRFEALEIRARLHPTPRRLEELARRVASWSEDEVGPATGVRVEVWRRGFEPAGLEPRPVLLRQLEVSLEGE